MDLRETLLWLCGISSWTGDEGKLTDELLQRFGALQLPDAVRRHGNSLVAPLTRGSGGPSIALVSRLDAVEAGQPKTPREEGGRVYGAGSAGAKSGLCLMLELAERRPAFKADVTLVLHARGEAGADGSELKPLLRSEPELARVDMALVLEPTDNKLELGCAGSTHAMLAFRGRSGHSALPGAGVNAIHKFASVVSELAAAQPTADTVEELTWYEIMQATAVSGGKPLVNVVPRELEVFLHHTYGPSTSTHDSQDKLIEMMNRRGALRFEQLSEPAAPKRNHPLIRSLERSASLEVAPRQTWTEVSRFAALGIAAANFGPGAERTAHARDDSTELEALKSAVTIVERWLSTLE